jgi:hypothetical protein
MIGNATDRLVAGMTLGQLREAEEQLKFRRDPQSVALTRMLAAEIKVRLRVIRERQITVDLAA